jgi:hypothetical protein
MDNSGKGASALSCTECEGKVVRRSTISYTMGIRTYYFCSKCGKNPKTAMLKKSPLFPNRSHNQGGSF